MSQKPTGLIVNPDTGDVTGEVYEGDRVIRKASVEYLNNTQVWKLDSFFMGHVAEIKNWTQELTMHEKAFLFSIVPYIGYEDCCFKERQFFINPWLFCKGNRINNVLKTMFRNYKIRVLGGVAWKNVN